MGIQKKKFFRRPTAPQILSITNNKEVTKDIWENISEMKNDESITIVGKLFKSSSDEFLKRGPSAHIPTFDQKNPLLLPYELRELAFNKLKEKKILHYNGFVFTPRLGPDLTPRRIRLNDVLEAARLYSYAPISLEQIPFKPSIQLHSYDSVDGVASIGATILAKVPSRIKGKGKYEIKIFHIPITDNPQKFSIAYMLKTNHVCEDKQHELKFPTKKNIDFVSEYRIDEHEIAAIYAIIDYYKNPQYRTFEGQKEKPTPNLIPLQMNLVGVPTTMLCTMYNKMLHRVMIQENHNSKPKTLDEGHLEALLWEGLIKNDYRTCFFKLGEGKMKDFAWTQYIK